MARAVSGGMAANLRKAKRLDKRNLVAKNILVDGFNAIVTLEVALTGGPIVACEDDTVRDLAGMRGTYHPCDQTTEAIRLFLAYFKSAGANSVSFLIDAPVSNSGRLRSAILQEANASNQMKITAKLERDVDAALSISEDIVVTSDSAILDRCSMWSNAVAEITNELKNVWMINIITPPQEHETTQ